MHVLVTVFFNAPQGGLHENILAAARYMLARRHRVTVVCKPGPFAERLRGAGAGVIETDYAPWAFAKALAAIEALHVEQPVDLVHAHPFASRQLGLIVAQVLGLPFVVTLHGKYVDALPSYIEQTDAVFTVSEGIRHYLLTEGGIEAPEKLHVVPNTPDAKLFKAGKVAPPKEAGGRVVVSLVTRLDQDKAFILEVFYQAVAHAAEHYPGRIHWQVVGQGTQEQAFAEKVETLRGDNSVSYTGWLQDEALRDAYCRSDAVIAPGRCALEAMSCAVPAIALGSKGYSGLVDSSTWQQAVFTNFGGVGNRHESYTAGAVEQDLDSLMVSAAQRRRLGRFGRQVVRQFFDAGQMHKRLLGFYTLAVAAHQASPREALPSEGVLELRLRDLKVHQPDRHTLQLEVLCEPVDGLSFAWYLLRVGDAGTANETLEKHPYRPDAQHTLTLPGPGRYQVRCFVQDNARHKHSFLSPIVKVP
ncbi:MAG: glycosyltransferase family 4 protein [Halomonas sp.]|nr:glycosyltransferase family 4 protein [Halomonas sp.]MDN6315601.1 glycosyltransferase family 4 protein [Halomonas sp.]